MTTTTTTTGLTAPKHAPRHDLMVVGPWWKWGSPVSTTAGRASRPVLQKYDSSTLVDQFLKNPQRALKFGDKDLVHVVRSLAAAPASSKLLRFSDSEYVPETPHRRKLFLDTHKRFYLVVCQIHCDMSGFPRASRDKICQAGFVVRRRTTLVPKPAALEAAAVLKALTAARMRQVRVESAWAGLRGSLPGKGALRLSDAKRVALGERRSSVQARVALEKARLDEIINRHQLGLRLEGWRPSPTGADRVGYWDTVEEATAALDLDGEVSFPLYPLVAPPDQPDHAGQHGTIYFGLLPTASRDTDDEGEPRFDDETTYEVRCFAQTHHAAHGRGEPCPCPGALYWSLPTEAYRLAAPMDLQGTSQQPITVTLPKLDELAAQAAPARGTRFVKPAGSLMVQGNSSGGIDRSSKLTIPEICFIPIPLITIVAMFVFELFLPVVMLLFGLFWMLKLKFCIPPEVQVAAGITAELELDASLSASLKAEIKANIDAGYGAGTELATELKDNFDPIALGNLAFDAAEAADPTTGVVAVSSDLEWEEEVSFA